MPRDPREPRDRDRREHGGRGGGRKGGAAARASVVRVSLDVSMAIFYNIKAELLLLKSKSKANNKQ